MKLVPMITAIFFLIRLPADAQPFAEKKYSFEMLTIDDGLSQGLTNWIMQDYMGFIWVATKDGLNRYDGSHFVVYRHDAKNEKSISDNYVNALFEDSKHRLWVGTGSSGLDLFDRASETFIHFSHDEKNKQSISANNVMEISEDMDGNLYAFTSRGINIIHIAENKTGKNTISFSSIDSSASGQIFSASKGEVWISPESEMLYTLTRENNIVHKTNMLYPSSFFLKYPKYSRRIKSFTYDSTRQFIYMLMSQDLVRYDASMKTWKHLDGYSYKGSIIGHGTVLDNAGLIWFANGLNLYIYDTKSDQTFIVTSDDARQMQMLSNASCVYKDKSGNLWIGTSGYGILKYNARAEKFHHTGRESITGIVENKDGMVMIVTQKPYADLFNKTNGKFVSTIPDTNNLKSDFGFLLNTALQDNRGNYWLSYAYNKLYIYDMAATNVMGSFTPDPYYFPLLEDNNDGIWYGSGDSLFAYDLKTRKLNSYYIPKNSVYNYYDFVEVIRQQNDSIYWLGTTNGLYKFNRKNITWKNYSNNPGDETSLSNNIIFSLCADPKNPGKYLWVGTNGFGLDRLDISSGKFTHFTTKEGLPNDVVYGVLSDDVDNLWISTNKGLSNFNPETRKFLNYEAKDGLQSNEFNRYAYCKTKDGTLFFGGVNGFNYFNPRDLGRNTNAPNIVITDFKIANKTVTIHDEKKLLTKPIEFTDKIILNYEDNMISFDFAAMDFTQPSKNLYQYKMENFDKDWIQSGEVHTATYTNLDPGTYIFHVRGSNSDGVWNEQGTVVQLEILPPWYMTWWFRTLLAITISGAAYSFYRYRLQQALKLQAIRNKIASDLHDEVGSNLSSISIFSDVAKAETEGTASALLNKISLYAHESMEAMNDIVWMINARNDRFENIINRMRELAIELSETKKFALHLDIDDRLNNVKLGMETRKNFWLIYKEAVNNAAKYSKAKTITISLAPLHDFIVLVVKDNGAGFDFQKRGSGNGVGNMQQRALQLKGKLSIDTSPEKGTSIELRFKI